MAAQSCSHCGKLSRVVLDRCSVCKHASYCGADCQRAGWKKHKKRCKTNEQVYQAVLTAGDDDDWWGVLEWEGRMEGLLAGQDDAACERILLLFTKATLFLRSDVADKTGTVEAMMLAKRRIVYLGKLDRLRDQGDAMNHVARTLSFVGQRQASTTYYQQARDHGAKHGFFSVECESCEGLGTAALAEGRHREALDLLRNALACVPLCEDRESRQELTVLDRLVWALLKTHAVGLPACQIQELFETNALDELEPLVSRYREAAKAASQREGQLSDEELKSLRYSARLLEAHGNLKEAARGLRALLILASENAAAVRAMPDQCRGLRGLSAAELEILEAEAGDAFAAGIQDLSL